jgi:hypothetical protein
MQHLSGFNLLFLYYFKTEVVFSGIRRLSILELRCMPES